MTLTEGIFSLPFPSVGEMFLGCWRLTVAAGEHEFPTRIMYRAEGIDWVRLSSLLCPYPVDHGSAERSCSYHYLVPAVHLT